MEMEKTYDKFDRKGLWDVLRMYGVEGHMLEGFQSFYMDANAPVSMKDELSESFGVDEDVRHPASRENASFLPSDTDCVCAPSRRCSNMH